MQTLLLPTVRSGSASSAAVGPTPPLVHRLSQRAFFSPNSLPIAHKSTQPLPLFSHSSSLSSYDSLKNKTSKLLSSQTKASNATAPAFNSQNDETEKAKLVQVAKRLENTSRYFKRLGNLGFWGQLICATVAAVILSFSVVVTGKIPSPPTFYATLGGIAAAFISVFWSFGYIRLSEKLRKKPLMILPSHKQCYSDHPQKKESIGKSTLEAPPRADVVKSLKNGIVLNLLGMGAAILGMQATVGLLVAKALTSSANPSYQQISPGYSPVLALDVFLVQAAANTILSHFLGLVFSMELLRSVTLPPSENIPAFKVA
ncbi:PROTEIN TIC 21 CHLOROPLASTIC [Salix viminalis]|uniref:PROTEIN TIC 21 CHLOROPLASTIC n=1 Tax=Salix viminalis TaxID=40686 RepID=A0A9Q0NJX8_SALVM|nr:PROTEIN TIC 21 CHLOROPLASTIC [Salix viminalis]